VTSVHYTDGLLFFSGDTLLSFVMDTDTLNDFSNFVEDAYRQCVTDQTREMHVRDYSFMTDKVGRNEWQIFIDHVRVRLIFTIGKEKLDVFSRLVQHKYEGNQSVLQLEI